MKNFCIKHKKGLIILAVVAVLVVALGFYVKKVMKQAQDLLASMQEQTAIAEDRDLSNVVAAVGSISSVSSEQPIANVMNNKVEKITVNVGDRVNEGDLICVLSSDDLVADLEDANRTLKNTQSSTNISVRSASRTLSEVQTDVAINKERNDKKLSDSKKKVEDYENLKNQSGDMYANAIAEAGKYEKLVKEAQKKVDDLTKALATTDVSGGELVDANVELTAARKELETLSAAYSAAQSAASQHLANYNSLVATINELEGSYDTIKQSNEDAARSAESKIASSKDSVSTANISKDNSLMTAEKSVENLEKQIEACNVYSPISGVVTKILVNEGDKYAGSAIMLIEDVSSYEIVTMIDEYDISKIEVGQKAVIKTNGTGDEILDGHVKSVSPRGESANGAVSYKVVVAVDTKNDNLRLDMTAKLSIIINEKKNVLTVPYEAVQYDTDGVSYVEVKKEDGTYEREDVTTGIANDFYIEITAGNIKEGTEIKVPRDPSDALDLSSMMIAVDDGGGF